MKKRKPMYERPFWWLLLIAICFGLWFLYIPAIIGLIILLCFVIQLKKMKKQQKDEGKKEHIDGTIKEMKTRLQDAEAQLNKELARVQKTAYLYNAVKGYIEKFRNSDFSTNEIKEIEKAIADIGVDNLMEPTAEVKLHSTDIKDLRKQYRQISHDIDFTLTEYEKRYTTKGNLAIYRLMVVALRSELQNVLYTMRFGRLEDAEEQITEICDKYIKIAADGNQSIAPTVTRFVTETKALFLDAVKVEYEYYLRKERAKEEQKALREQMRLEMEERRKLEAEQKKIEAEEAKYTSEISKLRAQIEGAEGEKLQQLADRIAELEAMQAAVTEKKEMITKLQNGKAGYVYVISNLGSFGDRVFKIGMTRRTEPQERVDELGSASVPFCFDVHSLIFSEDAPALESAIHHRLNDKRVNKVNLRKEFFDISIDELEALVYELEPTAEFSRTMAAEQYRQSLSMVDGFDIDSFDADAGDDIDDD